MWPRNTVLAITALSGLVCAQTEPVPTRILSEVYGVTEPAAIFISCDVWGNWGQNTNIKITGGAEDDLGCIFVGAAPAALPTPWGPLLVSPTAIPVVGVFNNLGEFAFPIDLAQPAWVGVALHMQGVCLDRQAATIELSGGLKVTYHEGNPQPPEGYFGPPLTYEGPALTTTLVRHESPFVDTMYSLVNRFAVPTHGYVVENVDNRLEGNELVVEVNLVAPHPSWDVDPTPTTVQFPVDLGPTVGQFVRIFVWESVALTPPLPRFNEAAVIDTDF